jgi:isoaspartyl peptidase/L-asparaginase-like protein (Ntn-hydrolase superfamily)
MTLSPDSIRWVTARPLELRAVDHLKNGSDEQTAAKAAVGDQEEKRIESTGGIILIDRPGNIGYAHNTTHTPVCSISGAIQVVLAS